MRKKTTNKAILLALATTVVFCMLLLCSCVMPFECKATFVSNLEGVQNVEKTVSFGGRVTPPTLTHDGYDFVGWYCDSLCAQKANVEQFVLFFDTAFYAKWEKSTPALTAIKATYGGQAINQGEGVDQSLLTVTAHFFDGTEQTLTSGQYTLSFDSNNYSSQHFSPLTVTYTCDGVTKTCTIDLLVKPKDPEIKLTNTNVNVWLNGNQPSVDLFGAKLVLDLATQVELQVEAFTLSNVDTSTAGEKNATISCNYQGRVFTQAVTVTVVVPTAKSLSAQFSKHSIDVGSQPNVEDLTVIATFSDGSTQVVTDFSVSVADNTVAGVTECTVTCAINGVTISVTFPIAVGSPEIVPTLQSISAVYAGQSVQVGSQPSKDDLTVTATFSNGSTQVVTNFNTDVVDSTSDGTKMWSVSYTFEGVTVSTTVLVVVAQPDDTINNADYNVNVIANEQLSIHFLELGNNYTGDCVYVKAGNTDILIDAGSRKNSATTIASYVNQYCTDGVLEYVVATHAHQDHIAGFVGSTSNKGIFDRYQCETIITYARTDATSQISKDFNAKRDKQVANGANCYTAKDCVDNTNGAQKVYNLVADGSVKMEILDQKFYHEKASDENDYSVCLLISQGDNHYLLTGDLEKHGEASLVERNPNLPHVKLFKAGHHGSPTSSNDALLQKITPEVVCVCCCAGSVEYTQNLANTFPSQEFVDRISKYTDLVYATTLGNIKQEQQKNGTLKYVDTGFTSLNGNIVFACTNGKVTMYFSNNNLKLKDTQWFKDYRTMPNYWK